MKRIFTMSLAAALCLTMTAPINADPKPDGAKRAPAQTVANYWAGKSIIWRDCKGGIYHGAGWQAVAWCEKNGPSVGIGTWSVSSRGILCHDLTWYWPEGDGTGSNRKPVSAENCDEHVVAADGDLWMRWQNKKTDANAWWNPERSDGAKAGFDPKLKRKINRLRKKLGV